jgi:hypothetical protein
MMGAEVPLWWVFRSAGLISRMSTTSQQATGPIIPCVASEVARKVHPFGVLTLVRVSAMICLAGHIYEPAPQQSGPLAANLQRPFVPPASK